MSSAKKKDLGFQLILLAWPVVQFFVFYIIVNINSFGMAFNFTDPSKSFFCFFEQVIKEDGLKYLKNAGISVLFFLIVHFFTVPLALLYSYYISKKFFGHKFFKVVLFLPSIISATVMLVIFKNFMNYDFDYLLQELSQGALKFEYFKNINEELFKHLPQVYAVILAFSIFISFGTTTLIYSNKMSEISTEILEAAKLDGVNRWQEFIHIVMPAVFPTLTTMLVTAVACIFTNQFNMFTFFGSILGTDGPIGYQLFKNIQGIKYDGGNLIPPQYSQMAALGLLCTAVTIPLVFGFKYLMERFGPSEK